MTRALLLLSQPRRIHPQRCLLCPLVRSADSSLPFLFGETDDDELLLRVEACWCSSLGPWEESLYKNIHRTPLTEVKHRAPVKDFRCFLSMFETVLPHEALDAVLLGARIVCSQLQNAERHNEHHQKKHTRRQWFAKCGSLSESCHAGDTAPSLNHLLVCSYSHTTQVSSQTALLIQVLAASSLVCHSQKISDRSSPTEAQPTLAIVIVEAA